MHNITYNVDPKYIVGEKLAKIRLAFWTLQLTTDV